MRYCNFMSDFDQPETGMYFHYLVPRFRDLHSHNYFEIFLITQGEVVHRINGKEFLLKKGSINLIRPSDEHEFLPVEGSSVSPMLVNVMIVPKRMEEILNVLGKDLYVYFLSAEGSVSIELSEQGYNSFYGMLDKFLLNGEANLQETIITMYVCEFVKVYFFEHYIEFNKTDLQIEKAIGGWLSDLLTKMRDPNNFEMIFDDLISEIHFSRVHVNRVFKRYMGESPVQYFIRTKLDYARNLLIASNLSILEIASKIGYSSLSYFSNLFKKMFGMTPKEYRNKYGAIQSRHAQ